ncbi:MAG: DUF4194 domain-containing protein [Candidatus Izemoplasmatales bacterium]
MILDKFEELSSAQKQLFSDTCNKLLSSGFLARDKKDNKEQYYFLVSYKNYFDEYFGVINYEIVLDREQGAIQLVQQENKNVLKLKKEESLVLLILRILYHQNLVKTSINENVIITVNEIHDRYDSLELKRKINKTDLVSILRLYKKHNLIESLGDITQSNTKIIVYPTILLALNTSMINDVYETIQKIVASEGGAEE